MTTLTDVEREITLLLAELEAECNRLEVRLQQTEEALEAARRKRSTLQDALDIYREHYKLPALTVVDEAMRQKLVGKTIREMIVTIAMESQPPIFRVVDVNRTLVKAGMFKNDVAARDSVYSTIGRNPGTFIRIAPGQYMVNTERAEAPESKPERKAMTWRNGSLCKKVAAILGAHPEWSRRQTLDELLRQGHDFKGKKPIHAVGACYATLKQMSTFQAVE